MQLALLCHRESSFLFLSENFVFRSFLSALQLFASVISFTMQFVALSLMAISFSRKNVQRDKRFYVIQDWLIEELSSD